MLHGRQVEGRLQGNQRAGAHAKDIAGADLSKDRGNVLDLFGHVVVVRKRVAECVTTAVDEVDGEGVGERRGKRAVAGPGLHGAVEHDQARPAAEPRKGDRRAVAGDARTPRAPCPGSRLRLRADEDSPR